MQERSAYKNQIFSFVEEILVAPASKRARMSSFSETSPPAMTGVEVD